MTREEAIKMAKAKLECIERRTSGKAELCREDCESCSLCYEQGNMGDQMKWLKMSVKALEQEPKADVLDKIRAEIEKTTSRYTISRERGAMGQVEWSDRLIKESEVLEIIDKYKAESEIER